MQALRWGTSGGFMSCRRYAEALPVGSCHADATLGHFRWVHVMQALRWGTPRRAHVMQALRWGTSGGFMSYRRYVRVHPATCTKLSNEENTGQACIHRFSRDCQLTVLYTKWLIRKSYRSGASFCGQCLRRKVYTISQNDTLYILFLKKQHTLICVLYIKCLFWNLYISILGLKSQNVRCAYIQIPFL